MKCTPNHPQHKGQSKVTEKMENSLEIKRPFKGWNAKFRKVYREETIIMWDSGNKNPFFCPKWWQVSVTVEDYQPISSRKIAEALKISRKSVTRYLYHLEKAGIIEVAFKGRCPVSGRRLKHYYVSGWEFKKLGYGRNY